MVGGKLKELDIFTRSSSAPRPTEAKGVRGGVENCVTSTTSSWPGGGSDSSGVLANADGSLCPNAAAVVVFGFSGDDLTGVDEALSRLDNTGPRVFKLPGPGFRPRATPSGELDADRTGVCIGDKGMPN